MPVKMTEEQLNSFMAKQIYISKVFIHGLKRTQDDFAKKVSKNFFEAKTFSQFFVKATEVQQTFNDLSVTSGVNVKLDVGDSDKDLHVHVTLNEKRWWSGGVQGFLGNDPDAKVGLGGGVTTHLKLLNVFGRGEKATACWSKGTVNAIKEISLVKPVGENLSDLLTASIFSRDNAITLSGFKQTDNGLSLMYSLPTTLGTFRLSWNGVWRQLMPLNDSTSFTVRQQAGHSLKSSVKYEWTYDTRDNDVIPKSGQLFKFSQELAGLGGDTNFVSANLSSQFNQTLVDRVTVQVGGSIGHVRPIRNLFDKSQPIKDISIMDTFFIGGPTSLRGFENKGIGPHSLNDALGGDFYWLSYAYLRLPLPGLTGGFIDRFRLQGFINCGNTANFTSMKNEVNTSTNQSLTPSVRDRIQEQRDTMRLSYGMGIVANFLGAKLELNYCLPLWFQAEDKVHPGFQFGISVGD